MNKDVWKKLRFFLFSLAILFLLPLQAKADTAPTKPTELTNRETKHHVFEAETDEYGNIAYHPEDELIMPGDTFEFKVYQFKNENGKKSFFSLGYWGEATDEHAYTYDFERRSSLPKDAGFDVTSTKCVSVTNSQSITKAGGSQYTVPVQYINSSDYPVLLSLGFSGSMGEYGEWYLTVGLHVSYYKPYYGISYEGSNNDQLSTYHWDAGNYYSLEFPKYYWLTDVPYTIDVPNPTTNGSKFQGWSGTSEYYCDVDGDYTKATVVYNAKAKPVYYGDTVNGTGDITFMPVFSGGSTIVFQGNGGTVNDRDSWILEATNTGTESNPVYTFNLEALVPYKQGDTFLGWCYKESALYGSFVTKDDGKAAYDHFFSGSNYGSTIKTLYAKWASDTEETLEKNEWELSDDGTLWILNNNGVLKWETAREADGTLPGKVKNIKTGYKDENPTQIGGVGIFAGCTQLEEVTFEGTAVNGSYTFRGCSNLKKINLDATGSNTHWAYTLQNGGYQFEGCDMDLSINVPEGQLEYYKYYYPDYAYLFNADPADHRYAVTVGDRVISDENLSVPCGKGTATFDPQTSTLTLQNATISGNTVLHTLPRLLNADSSLNVAAIASDLPNLKIVLKGRNIVYNDSKFDLPVDFVRTTGNLEVSGDGSIEEELLSSHYNELNEAGESVPYDGIFRMTLTAFGDVVFDGVTVNKLYADLPETLTIKNATINGTKIKAAKGLTIENSLVNRDTSWGGPNNLEETVIGTESGELSISQSKIGDQSGQVNIDCGDNNVSIKFIDSIIKPKDMIRAGSETTMLVKNSDLQVWCKEDTTLNITGATTVPVANITLQDCAITKGAWDGDKGNEFAIGHTGENITGPTFLSYTVTFDTGVGSAVPSQTVKAGEKIQKPADPTRASFVFDGWFTDKWNYKNAYDFNAKVGSDFTLYAKWKKAGTTPTHTHIAETAKWLSDSADHWHVCKSGDGYVMDKAAHTWDEGKVTKTATETAEGEMTYTCTICGFEKKEVISKLEAKPTTDPAGQGGQQGGQDQPGTTQTAELPKAGTEVQDQTGATYVVTGTEKDETGKEVATLAYAGDEKASGKVEIPETTQLANGADAKVTEIEDNAFEKNAAITAVTIPESVKTIGKNAFKDCKNIKTITIKGDEVTAIGDGAFQGCKKLGSFTIGKKVSKVGKNAFSGCSKLKKIYVYSTKLTKKKVGKKAFGSISKKAVVYYAKSTNRKQLKNLKAAFKKGGAPGKISFRKLKK